jgi:hypothetical protein
MATLPPIKRILNEDVPNAPSWFGRVMYIVNTFMQNVYAALQGQLTFQQNFLSQINTTTFTTSLAYTSGSFTPIVFSRTLGVKATGMIITQIINSQTTTTTPITTATALDWRDLGNGNLQINFISGLANSTQYTVTTLTF